MISIKIKTNLIDKNRIHRGKKHNYLDLVLFENKHGRDEFGYDGFVKQGLTKEEREERVEMPIIGNYTVIERRSARPAAPAPAPSSADRPDMAEDDIPF